MNYKDRDVNIDVMVGKTIEDIQVYGDHSVLFICTDEDVFEAYHMQDCCEYVRIHDIVGDIKDLIGKKITTAVANESEEWPLDVECEEGNESFTWTTHEFKAEDGTTVKFRWLGESNGYYSESVYFGRSYRPIKLAEDNDLIT